jgi:hypothetical protein
MADELPSDNLPESVALTPEQIVAQAEADDRDRQRQLQWDAINQALSDDAMAVTRAMRRFRHGDDQEQVERVLEGYDTGAFLVDRLGAEGVIDQDLAVVLVELRRRLIEDYGDGPAMVMLVDRAVVAYRDFFRITGWTGNLAILIEAEFFGRQRPSAHLQDRRGSGVREIHGLTVEQHLARLREELIPLAERCGRVMRDALASLEMLRGTPSEAVERSRPVQISVLFPG